MPPSDREPNEHDQRLREQVAIATRYLRGGLSSDQLAREVLLITEGLVNRPGLFFWRMEMDQGQRVGLGMTTGAKVRTVLGMMRVAAKLPKREREVWGIDLDGIIEQGCELLTGLLEEGGQLTAPLLFRELELVRDRFTDETDLVLYLEVAFKRWHPAHWR